MGEFTKSREDYDPELVKMAEAHEHHEVPRDKQCGLCYLKSNLAIEDTLRAPDKTK